MSQTKLIAEILDSRNRELVARTGVREFIISNSLISMMVAQVSENGLIQSVYDDLFDEDGSEIYLKPVEMYFAELPVQVQLAEIGLKDITSEDDAERHFGVELIPPKDRQLELKAGDTIVVVSEDET